MENGYWLNIAKLEPFVRDEHKYFHWARVRLDADDDDEAKVKADVVRRAMQGTTAHTKTWKFDLTHWRATGRPIRLTGEETNG